MRRHLSRFPCIYNAHYHLHYVHYHHHHTIAAEEPVEKLRLLVNMVLMELVLVLLK